MEQLTFEQSAFHSLPWYVLMLFILLCNFKDPRKPIISSTWLISVRCVGLMLLAIYGALLVGGYFSQWDFYKEFHALKAGYLLVPLILVHIGTSLENKELSIRRQSNDV